MRGYMKAYRVLGLLWRPSAWQLCAGLFPLMGFWIRPVSVLPAGWCLRAAVVFHTDFLNPNQLIDFFKNMLPDCIQWCLASMYGYFGMRPSHQGSSEAQCGGTIP